MVSSTQAADGLSVTIDRLFRLGGESSVKAFCDVRVGDSFVIKGVRIVDGKNGLFVSMPREQGKDGDWHDIVYPSNKAMYDEFQRIVLEAYHATGDKAVDAAVDK